MEWSLTPDSPITHVQYLLEYQVGCHPRLDRPADHLPVEQIDRDCQIRPVLGGGGAGDVACPLAAGSVGRKAAIQHIRCHEQVVLVEFVAAL